MWALCVHISEPEIKNNLWYNFFMWILNTLVAIESSYFSVCQHVPVQISNFSASVVALTAFVRHLPHVRPHLYLKTWCVYAREVLVTFVCLFTSMCHLVFLQLMYILVCKSQGGRTWQAFGRGQWNGHETFRQSRIYNFRDKCVVFARNLKFLI